MKIGQPHPMHKPIYFSGLNGLRAIAAMAVVISHITLNLGEFHLNPFIFGSFQDGKPQGLNLAGYGVSIFFVISGFLITYLLQAEKEIQPVNIKKFYMRRILRIWPLYYIYLILVLATLLAFGIAINLKMLLLYVFFAANVPYVLDTALPLLAHYWSIGVEEQFYLFWPWLNKKTNALLTLTLALIIILLGAKISLHLFHPGSLFEAALHVTRFHCMLIGALG